MINTRNVYGNNASTSAIRAINQVTRYANTYNAYSQFYLSILVAMQINVLPTVVYGYAYRMIYASSWTDYVIWNTNDRVKNGSNSIAIGLTMRLQHVLCERSRIHWHWASIRYLLNYSNWSRLLLELLILFNLINYPKLFAYIYVSIGINIHFFTLYDNRQFMQCI